MKDIPWLHSVSEIHSCDLNFECSTFSSTIFFNLIRFVNIAWIIDFNITRFHFIPTCVHNILRKIQVMWSNSNGRKSSIFYLKLTHISHFVNEFIVRPVFTSSCDRIWQLLPRPKTHFDLPSITVTKNNWPFPGNYSSLLVTPISRWQFVIEKLYQFSLT